MESIKSELKKILLRKFRELGFEIFTEFIPYLSEKCFDNFIDEIEKNKLLMAVPVMEEVGKDL